MGKLWPGVDDPQPVSLPNDKKVYMGRVPPSGLTCVLQSIIYQTIHIPFFLFKFFCLSDGGAGGGYLKEEK